MKAAQVTTWGEIPKYVDIPAPQTPPPADTVQIKVLAAGIHRVVRTRAEGAHFSATTLPHIPGTDGVGRTIPGNDLVYFSVFWERGSLCEIVNVPKQDVTSVPEGADPVLVAGLANPAMSSWMALRLRTNNLPEKFTVLIVGATSVAGGVALQLARKLGASKVIGCARNEKAMRSMGYDDIIVLREPATDTDFSSIVDGVDVILDYVYGPIIEHLFNSLKPKKPVQFCQVGTLATLNITLPGATIRAKNITIRGAAPGSYSGEEAAREDPGMMKAVSELKGQQFKLVDLKDIEKEWPDEKTRMVVKIQEG
jgi:NADPH:quinone reductase-like Zn-dependent oxidoreductase